MDYHAIAVDDIIDIDEYFMEKDYIKQKSMGEIKTITFQLNISIFNASIIKYTLIQLLNGLQKLINNLLNLQTTYLIATNKSYQNYISDIIKLKYKQSLGENILLSEGLYLLINKLSLISRSQ